MKRKFTMPGQDALQALYPPMSEKDRNAILDTMRSLKNDAEEKSVMKRKLSFGLALGLILVLLTCAALAVSAGVFGWFAGESQSGDGELFKKLDETSVQNGQTQTVAASDDAKYPVWNLLFPNPIMTAKICIFPILSKAWPVFMTTLGRRTRMSLRKWRRSTFLA